MTRDNPPPPSATVKVDNSSDFQQPCSIELPFDKEQEQEQEQEQEHFLNVIPMSSSSSSSLTSEGSLPAVTFVGENGGNQVVEGNENVGADGVKKPAAWNKPKEVGVLMGEEKAWPPLSDAVKSNEPKIVALGSKAEVTSIPTPSSSIGGAFTRQKSVKLDGATSSGQTTKMANRSVSKVVDQENSGVSRDVQQHPRPFRRNSTAPLSRGDNSYGNRGINAPHQGFASRPPIRGPPPYAPFRPPPPYFVPQMIYPEQMPPHLLYQWGHPPEWYRPPVPMVPLAPPIHPGLHSKIVNQVDYYFSTENLPRDSHLRKMMDSEGWVPIKSIAAFPKMRLITEDIQVITNALQASTVVEVQGYKLRRKNDWHKWPLPSMPTSS